MSRGGRYRRPAFLDTRTFRCIAGASRSGDATGEGRRPPTVVRVVLLRSFRRWPL